jgi:polyphenol oxidase
MPIETIINPEVRSQKSVAKSQKSDEQILSENGFFWRETDGVKVLVSKQLEENGFANGFSTRIGGVSPFPAGDLNLAGFGEDTDENIAENRRRFLKNFDQDFKLTTVWQVHSDLVKKIETPKDIANTEDKFDALVSNLPNILVGVKTADCVPVLIGDKKTKSFAAIHAGWRGTVESIVIKAIEKMRENYGSNSEDLICAIGPAAGCENYEIGADVIETFSENFPNNSKHLFTPTRENHALIDLHTANKEQLVRAGVLEENISIAPFCTMQRTDLFFSYRVEKKKYGKTGRLMSVIGLKK